MPGIEFVDPEPDLGPDEELDDRPQREWSPRATRTVVATVLAVVAATVLVATLHRGTTARPGHRAGTTRIAQATPPIPTLPIVIPSRAGATSVLVLPPCPNLNACSFEIIAPARVSAALRSVLPDITDIACTTLEVDGRPGTLRARRLTARAGPLGVRVEINPATRYDHPRVAALDASGGERLVYARVLIRGFAITVSVTGPAAETPRLATVRRLAADRRLRDVG